MLERRARHNERMAAPQSEREWRARLVVNLVIGVAALGVAYLFWNNSPLAWAALVVGIVDLINAAWTWFRRPLMSYAPKD